MRRGTKRNKPFIIGISGESGVGKTTITEIVSMYFGIKNVTSISTDDLHKWERTNKAWQSITHLNPEANNLELGDMHIERLSQGKPIYRSVYNHTIGGFNPPVKIEPQSVIIIEGLHAFYTDISKRLIDLKIFIDTDDALRTHWKIIRDTEERGYKYNDVLESIRKRRADSSKVREAQIGSADVIIKIEPTQPITCLGSKSEKIDLTLSISFAGKPKHPEIFEFIESYTAEFNKFIDLSDAIGNDVELCQNGGGNISVKVSDRYMLIKSSGFDLKDVFRLNGYSVIDYELLSSFKDKINDERVLSFLMVESLAREKYKRPSMETGLHVLLPGKYVIHAHAIYVTLLLCLDNSRELVSKLYSNYAHEYVEYVSPGYGLYDRLRLQTNADVYFLENHGLIVASNDADRAHAVVRELNEIAKEYISSKCDFEQFSTAFADRSTERGVVFPDAAIFADDPSKAETIAASNYIKIIGAKIGSLRYLTPEQLHHITNLEAEKYRKTL
jgi:uridine kinase/ribulose-5-phosphate 4-epimerase/fuculose-1-phosphate aldolase